jgi:DNA mismatch repair protein MutS
MDKKLLVDEYLDYHRELVNKKIGEKNVVLLQNGMFYELYNYRCVDGPDLFAVADMLGIQLARKNKEIEEVSRHNYEMVGFPMHAQQKFINILLHQGYTIAIYNQDENGKKNVSRNLDQIISASTCLDYNNSYDHNYLMCIYLEPHRNQKDEFYICAYSLIDLSIGNNYVYETSSRKGDFQYGIDKLYQVIKLYNPKELLIHMNKEYCTTGDSFYTKERLIIDLELDIDGRLAHFNDTPIHPNFFKPSYQNSFLSSIFPKSGLLTAIEYLDLEKYPSTIICYMLLLEFAKQHRSDIIQKISRPMFLENNDNLILTQNSIYQLNIVPDKNSTTGKSMSLVNLLNNCSTAFGKRLFRERLLNPIFNINNLNSSYEKIELIKPIYRELEEMLGKILDMERLSRRLALKILSPIEFNNFHLSSIQIINILNWISARYSNWIDDETIKTITSFKIFMNDYSSKIDINKLYRYHLKGIERSIFISGIFPDLDKIDLEIEVYQKAFELLAHELSSYIEQPSGKQPDISLVSVCQNDKEGYYLELTQKRCQSMIDRLNNKTIIISVHINDHIEEFKVDTKDLTYQNNSGASKITRISGKIIKRWSEKIDENIKKMTILAGEHYKNILDDLDSKYHIVIKKITSLIGEIDIIKSHAKNAILYNLVRPTISECETSYIDVVGLRHPIVEAVQTKTPFIANDIILGKNNINMVLCYGYNAVGKTTKQKAICIAIIMAQSGGFVSATSMTYSPYRYIFTRISNVDNLLKNQSSFMVEMTELKYILKHADKKSMVCIDELVASTERFSGIALVASTILELHKRDCSMFMATHLHELSKMEKITNLDKLKIYHLEVHYNANTKTLIYDRKLREGAGTGLYGLEVARYLELDNEFMNMAFEIRNEILGNETQVFNAVQSNYNPNVFLEKCQTCGYKPTHSTDIPLETHHIHFQCNADQDGNFKELGFHKNVEHNLVILCRDCHQKVHQGYTEIKGYIATGNGPILEVFNHNVSSENNLSENKLPSRKKFSEEQIQQIKSFVEKNPQLKKKDILYQLSIHNELKLDYKLLSKIISNHY